MRSEQNLPHRQTHKTKIRRWCGAATHRLRISKAVRIFCRLWYYCGQTKNHRQNGGDFSRNGGPNRDRTDDLTDANRTLSQLSYRPILPLFAGFCNKKLIFKFSDFRRIQRKTSPKSWTETRRSMCDHRDANRTLSQLSYGPISSLFAGFLQQKADFQVFRF